MPRKKYDEQIYKLPLYGATVTVKYDANNPPPFFQPSSGVVIVGDHECGAAAQSVARTSGARGGNLLDINDPKYNAMKERLGPAPETPEASRPYTTEDAFRDAGIDLHGQQLDLGALAASVPAIAANDE